MLVKFENKSHRVKGLAFHPRRPWVLASLHNGVIELWDYRMDTKIEEFSDHEGPVRGVDFHRTQPLFVSGGDDYKINVWNYQQKRCLFPLLGHLDYIRTVQFHSNYPWVLSASDDQTIRMWNWQSRTCLAVLTGHNHYVMSAQFHPTKDIVLSASLDQTARVWDISGLRKKSVSPMAPMGDEGGMGGQNEIFGGSDVFVQHVLEGHNRGVNWAAFHPTMAYIATAADDREVKLWRMNENRAWEIDIMRGHTNNVSCVVFHPKKDLIISNSEDKTIRVWDMNKESAPQVLRRDTDRYWILAVHPHLNLIGAGHDSGMVVFKLERERPAYDSSPSHRRMYYFDDNHVNELLFKTSRAQAEVTNPIFRRSSRITDKPRTLLYNYANRSQHAVLLMFDREGGTYELHVADKARRAGGEVGRQHTYKGFARSAAFVSRTRFVVLDRQRQLYTKDLKNDVKKRLPMPGVTVNQVFPGGLGNILLRLTDSLRLYDIRAEKVVGELVLQSRKPIKYVVWSAKSKYVAAFSKSNIHIARGKNLEECCFICEHSRIKSGAWDGDVFVYNTHTHIKYLLPNGDNGIIRTIEEPIYITQVATGSQALCYLDRDRKSGIAKIDPTEYVYKRAVTERKYKTVVRIMRSGRLVGKSIIAYLQKKGFPEVALHFVKDERIKFQLALQCGNIAAAKQSAQRLEEVDAKRGKACWEQLGVEALRQGVCHVVEEAYMKTANFDRLSFLYTITGNRQNLQKMLQIAVKHRTDNDATVSSFHNTLYLGDVEQRVQCLVAAGMPKLAFVTARAHGLKELEEKLLKGPLEGKEPQGLPDLSNAKLLYPPVPILRARDKADYNWPLVEVSSGYFNNIDISNMDLSQPDEEARDDVDEDEDEDEAADDEKVDLGDWGVQAGGESKQKAADDMGMGGDDDGGWGGLGDDDALGGFGLDIDGEDGKTDDTQDGAGDDDASMFVMPSKGKPWGTKWSESSRLAGDLAAAGAFNMSLHSLNRQLGCVSFGPLETTLIKTFNMASVSLPGVFGTQSMRVPLFRAGDDGDLTQLPRLCFDVQSCVSALQQGYKEMSMGRFAQAMVKFQSILRTVPVLEVASTKQAAKLKELVNICRDYITACRLELTRRKEGKGNPARNSALSAYMTRCELLVPKHKILALVSAIKIAIPIKNFRAVAAFCRRFLELATGIDRAQLAKMKVAPARIRAILKKAEAVNKDEVPVDYREGEALNLDCKTLKPIPKGTQPEKCPYCGSAYHPDCEGNTCNTCGMSKIGADAVPYRPGSV